MYFSTAKEMERLDELAVSSGLEIRQMMELAGWHMLSVFNDLKIDKDKNILIVCGRGNKGGDGLSAARHLTNYGYNVSIILLSKNLKPDSQHHLELLQKIDLDILFYEDNKNIAKNKIDLSDVIIDALLGYHLEGNPREDYAEVINIIGKTKTKVIAYDMPSGIDATTGQCLESCIKAHVTLSLALAKKVFDTNHGLEKSGKIYVADIGIPGFLYDKIANNSRPNFNKRGFVNL